MLFKTSYTSTFFKMPERKNRMLFGTQSISLICESDSEHYSIIIDKSLVTLVNKTNFLGNRRMLFSKVNLSASLISRSLKEIPGQVHTKFKVDGLSWVG